MNYAAILATMVVLCFAFPLVSRLAAEAGVPEATSMVILGSLTVLAVVSFFVRRRVDVDRARQQLLDTARKQVSERPSDPRSYIAGGQHLARLLLASGRLREAAEVIDRYSCLPGVQQQELVSLQEELSSTDRWRFKKGKA